MKIGIVIAIARELKAFLEKDYTIKIENVNNHEVYITNINGNDVYAIKSGYGLIDASAATQLLITKYDVEVILNFGVTGALVKGLQVHDLFYVESAVAYGYDVSPIDPVKVAQYEEFKDEYIPLDESLINKVKERHPELKKAVVASGDKFIDNKTVKTKLAKQFNTNICDMEIAAIARTSYMNNVKCLSIKCISDTFEGDGGDFASNVNEAAKKAFAILEELLFIL